MNATRQPLQCCFRLLSTQEGSQSRSQLLAVLRAGQVPTYVVLPRGAHPSVSKFLALHLELFPILGLELLDPAGVSYGAG